MSEGINQVKEQPKVRLKFIDMARSIAILLMLEGHFIDSSLIMEARDPNSIVFSTWLFIRSFTAAIFLTVTGLIFVYLLIKKREESWFSNIRIRKGFKRVVELFFWGYLVQWYAFHVLECIGVGILSILLIYGVYKLVKVIPLWIYFLCAGIGIFALYPYVQTLPHNMAIPESIWYSVVKLFDDSRTPVLWFSSVPFVGFTMFGAMFGALLHDFHLHVKKLIFPAFVAIAGIMLFFFNGEILGGLDDLFKSIYPSYNYRLINLNWLYERLGMVLMVLSLLMYIDKIWGDRIGEKSLFIKVGQNTLTIYVLHMVLLYGSILGVGLYPFINKINGVHPLNPWEATFGAVIFIAFFLFLIKHIEWIKRKLSFVLTPIKTFFNFIFLIR